MFNYAEERYESPALHLTYHLAPWDEPFLHGPAAAISAIRVRTELEAAGAFEIFRNWCTQNSVNLVSCRLPQDQLTECGFLEQQGFRFIELNYRPILFGLDGFKTDREIDVRQADLEDLEEISAFAGEIFTSGRFHVDPQVGAEIGNRRYRAWAANAFRHPRQRVLKCCMEGRTVAFMVVEQPVPTSRFWSLVGLAPGLQGRGLGRRVWRAVIAFHRDEGATEVSTSISSHNVAVHNLYAALGFRFPAPTITLHWCPLGPR
jgi:RimJ/RimL family protein N-acetyltransferase